MSQAGRPGGAPDATTSPSPGPNNTPFLELHLDEDTEENDECYVLSSDEDDEEEDQLDDDDDDDDDKPAPLKPIGSLHGGYTVVYVYLSGRYQRRRDVDTFSLAPSQLELWGQFDFGVLCGSMYFPERPRQSSRRRVEFNWRGREQDDGPTHDDEELNTGWVRFLGGGSIEGHIDFLNINFKAEKDPEQIPLSPISDIEIHKELWDEDKLPINRVWVMTGKIYRCTP